MDGDIVAEWNIIVTSWLALTLAAATLIVAIRYGKQDSVVSGFLNKESERMSELTRTVTKLSEEVIALTRQLASIIETLVARGGTT